MSKQKRIKMDPAETSSISSEQSAAIVSLYNSWSTCGGITDTLLDNDLTDVAIMEPDELLSCLKKRCRSEDLPPVPRVRARKRPNCLFLNYMGTREMNEPTAVLDRGPDEAMLPELEFDFGGDDPLYPVVVASEKSTHGDADSKPLRADSDRSTDAMELLEFNIGS